MASQTEQLFRKSALCLAITSVLLMPENVYAYVEEEAKAEGFEKIIITASRRTDSVQEAPINITALNSDVMKDHNIASPEDVARFVPGLAIPDQGGAEAATIIVRGLNTNSSGRVADGGTVATYFGEIPLNSDLRINDLERVEVLIGPQGTLYGAGSLGGAIRYIFNKPDMEVTEGQISGDIFSLNESSGTGTEAGLIFNLPLVEDELAVRFNLNYFDTPGYVDYNYILKEPGVSNPDPDWNDSADVDANIKQVEDANYETVTGGRIAIRWTPNDWFDGTLSYLYQDKENGGNSVVHNKSLSSDNRLSSHVGPYENTSRYPELFETKTTLTSLELEFDLGFAELISATGLSQYDFSGLRDQTDLLMDIWSGYADFPAFTTDVDDNKSLSQELRLVSQSDSDLSWIVGLYYNKSENNNLSKEFTPGLTDAFFDGVYDNIEFDMEFISIIETVNKEKAIFGEVAYQFSDKLTAMVGMRYYEYDLASKAVNHAPFYDGPLTDLDDLNFTHTAAKDNGNLFKFNLGYDVNDDFMTYFTVSEGFRLGGANGVPACTNPPTQVCGLPNELEYTPDTTLNTEIGFKSSWLKRRLILNGALFSVDWNDAQISSVTKNGAAVITTNAGKAESKGVEFSARAMITDDVTAFATYSLAKAELTEDAPFLLGVKDAQGTALQDYYDGKKGDRLPGAPEQQFSFGLKYETDVMDDKVLAINYGFTWQSDVYTKVGLKADGEVLPAFGLSNLSATLSGDEWTTTFYIDNMFDKYAYTGLRRDKSWAGMARFSSENRALPELQRTYGHNITKPRTMGIRFTYNFEIL